ncbi:MAG TPA: hypothetical protein VGM90_11285 [Kofleriaceae bacterium]|jgi:hypothetical protein
MNRLLPLVLVAACKSTPPPPAPPPTVARDAESIASPAAATVTVPGGVKKPAAPVGKDPCTRENLADGYTDGCRDLGPWDSELAVVGRGGARPCAATVTKNEQPFLTATYAYDAQGHFLDENVTGSDGVEPYRRSWTYDSEGRVLTYVSTRMANISERYTYASGRLVSVDDGSSPLVFARDAAGAVVSALYKGSSTAMTYTDDSIVLTNASSGQTTAVTHDANGRRTKLARKSGDWGQERTYGYDKSGRLATITYREITTAAMALNGTITIKYDASGIPLEHSDVGNGTTYRYVYRYDCP